MVSYLTIYHEINNFNVLTSEVQDFRGPKWYEIKWGKHVYRVKISGRKGHFQKCTRHFP